MKTNEDEFEVEVTIQPDGIEKVLVRYKGYSTATYYEDHLPPHLKTAKLEYAKKTLQSLGNVNAQQIST